MKQTKRILLYGITLVVLVFAFVWEYLVTQWAEAQPDGGESTVRVDTFVLWPLVITLSALSLYQLFKKKK